MDLSPTLTPEQIRVINPRIRLTQREQLALRDAAAATPSAEDSLRLYGSRRHSS
ncbi:MAG: hypothetical protein H7125_14300 [Proteobacteria bacterium]|nr:hypothetical protein [Burkholderiales bacterium]